LTVLDINRDSFDPQFGAALRSIGPVKPSPTQSNSSIAQPWPEQQLPGNQPIYPSHKNNPALLVVNARQKFAEQAEAEFEQYGRKGFGGRRFLDVTLLRQILTMRDLKGMSDSEIEQQLGLQKGVLLKLTRGVISNVSEERGMQAESQGGALG
jgi:hypothetical protein